ncbi:hypothetical protein HGRIS_011260 [Hohenbuehelia grisea]|uniref:DUF5648 domain-containing protein n=1 Tax=Hohenbuehelia grisea TaxID=104357 RepID=A0ABR3JWR4_9AGAR
MKLTSSFLLAALCALQFVASSPAELPYRDRDEPTRTRTRVIEVTETVTDPDPPVGPPTRTVTETERITVTQRPPPFTVTVTRQGVCTPRPPPPPPPPPPHPVDPCQLALKHSRLVQVYQYYNPTAEDHFYTTNPNRINGGGYAGRTPVFKVYERQVPGTLPLRAFWKGQTRTHAVSSFLKTIQSFYKGGFVNEPNQAILGYVWPGGKCGGRPLQQLYKGVINYQKKYPQGNVYTRQRGVHDRIYTIHQGQVDNLKRQGYKSEGITAWVMP